MYLFSDSWSYIKTLNEIFFTHFFMEKNLFKATEEMASQCHNFLFQCHDSLQYLLIHDIKANRILSTFDRSTLSSKIRGRK